MSALLYRVGGLTVRWRFAVFALWVLLAIGLSLAVARVGAETDDNLSLPGTDSQSATDLLAARFPPQQNGKSPIVFRVSSGKVTDPKNSQVIDAAHKAIKSLPHTYSAVNAPFSDQGAGQVSKNGRTAFIPCAARHRLRRPHRGRGGGGAGRRRAGAQGRHGGGGRWLDRQ